MLSIKPFMLLLKVGSLFTASIFILLVVLFPSRGRYAEYIKIRQIIIILLISRTVNHLNVVYIRAEENGSERSDAVRGTEAYPAVAARNSFIFMISKNSE